MVEQAFFVVVLFLFIFYLLMLLSSLGAANMASYLGGAISSLFNSVTAGANAASHGE